MKVLIVSGFLGSGKTSLVLRLARYVVGNSHGDGIQVMIVENEIGETSIDQSFLKTLPLQVKNLFAGCACCTLADEVADTFRQIKEEIGPQLVILEATGVAVPSRIRGILEGLGIPSRICTVVDAGRWERIKIPLKNILEPQLTETDCICINKTDCSTQDGLEAMEKEITALNKEAYLSRMSLLGNVEDQILDRILGWSDGRT